MISLLKKELNSFFGSLSGYLVVSIFLLVTSLFLWVFDGNFNIIEGQRASLKGFFELAPWLYLFLIPAITMRMFAEEKRNGTIEMLITRPIKTFQIVWAKYLAALLLVFISILPTLLYFFSVYQLGNPIGNIDTGATWGSYIGLFLLASIYIAIGLFASAITNNQVIAFLLAIAFSFTAYLGFDFAATTSLPVGLQNILLKIGINEHYISLSRGVVDSRDIYYFLAASLLFLFISKTAIQKSKRFQIFNKKILFTAIVFIGLSFVFINIRVFRVDLTAEKRYSLSQTTKSLLNYQREALMVEIFLAGKLPAAMQEFQSAIIEKIEDLNAYSSFRMVYDVINVYEITDEIKRNQLIEQLIDAGIEPVNFGHRTTEGLSTQQIFPGVIVSNKSRSIALNLLKNNPLLSSDEKLQQSIELLEYEFARAIRILQSEYKPRVAFLDKPGMASKIETSDLRYTLNENYEIVDRTAFQLLIDDTVQTLIVAAPTIVFTEEEKINIDQFIMQGGRVLWCIDPISVSIDSLSIGLSTLAFEKGLNLRDQLFKYGARINANLLQDAFCLQYPINTAPANQQSKFTPAPFYYSPLALPNPSHPLSRNLNNVMLEFASSVDLVGENENVSGSIILGTSPYAREVNTPVEVSLLTATNPPDRHLFNQANIPIGLILEGNFESAFANRMTKQLGFSEIITSSSPSKMIVIADGDILKNKVRFRNGQYQVLPLGQDQYYGQTYGNRDFLANCIDYLTDDSNIMQIRSKVVKLRMLDKVKIREEKLKWQLFNVVSPLVFFMMFGLSYYLIRKRIYTHTKIKHDS